MSYVTSHLDDESGIQYTSVEDKTNLNQIGGQSNMLMLIEDIPRGRLDQAMTITHANRVAVLGAAKDNLYLQAVEDALDQGMPSVQVMRVSSSSGGKDLMGCEGAISSITLGMLTSGGYYEAYINDELIDSGYFYDDRHDPSIATTFLEYGIIVIPLNESLQPSEPSLGATTVAKFENLSDQYVKIKIIATDANPIDSTYPPLNPTVMYDYDLEGVSKGVSFCLAPVTAV